MRPKALSIVHILPARYQVTQFAGSLLYNNVDFGFVVQHGLNAEYPGRGLGIFADRVSAAGIFLGFEFRKSVFMITDYR